MIGLKMNSKEIIEVLDSYIPNPKCELEFNKDYELVLATMLSAQTTDKRVNMVTKELFKEYDTLEKLNKLSIKEIEDKIKTIGMYRQKAKHFKSIVSELVKIGYVPNNREYLESLSGVGRKTANVVLAVLYNEPCIAVDTHVARVSKRLGLANENDDVITIEQKLMKLFPKEEWIKLHYELVLFGRYHCLAKKPLCENCKLKKICKYKKSSNNK